MNFNKEQQQVVAELDRNILLLASAGTGKTSTLAQRVAHILASDRAIGKEILCLTFTNKASREIKRAVTEAVGEKGKDVRTGTFHEFCLQILQEEGKQSDRFFRDMVIFDEEECDEILREVLPTEEKYPDMTALRNFVALVKEYRALYGTYTEQPEKDYHRVVTRLYEEEGARLASLFTHKNKLNVAVSMAMQVGGHKVVAEYDRRLAEARAVDFTDLIAGVHELFRSEAVRIRWQQRYSYICIDEIQDTGALEYEVMQVLWEGNHVLLCGDFFQTIYEWRGSNPNLLLDGYTKQFNPITIIFYENYRATQTLFNASLKLLKNLFPQELARVYETLPYSASTEEGKKIVLHEAADEEAEGAYIFQKIQSLPMDTANRCCVLVRQNRRAQVLSQILHRLNETVPAEQQRNFMIIDQFRFYRRQEIKDVLAFFKLTLNPYDVRSAKRIIGRFVEGVGEKRVAAIESEECRRAGLRLTDFMDLRVFEEEPYARLLQALEEESVVVFDVESTGVDTTEDEIIQIAAIRIDKKGAVKEVFEKFLKPSKTVGLSEQVHGFSDAFLAEHGESSESVLEEFRKFSAGKVIVGHNVQYDISIFASELTRHNLGETKFAGVYDTLDIYRRFHPNLVRHKLDFLSETFATAHRPSHNAMDDILATAELLIQGVARDILPTEDERRRYILQYKGAFAPIAAHMATLKRKSFSEKPSDLLAYIMNTIGVSQYYENRKETERIQYIRELYRVLKEQETEPDISVRDLLNRALRQASLTAGEVSPRANMGQTIPIITVHQSKGSEYDSVFLAGMEEGVFPFFMAQREGREDEEKRLFYVAVTRAKKELTITYAKADGFRRKRGSSFLEHIPKEYLLRE